MAGIARGAGAFLNDIVQVIRVEADVNVAIEAIRILTEKMGQPYAKAIEQFVVANIRAGVSEDALIQKLTLMNPVLVNAQKALAEYGTSATAATTTILNKLVPSYTQNVAGAKAAMMGNQGFTSSLNALNVQAGGTAAGLQNLGKAAQASAAQVSNAATQTQQGVNKIANALKGAGGFAGSLARGSLVSAAFTVASPAPELGVGGSALGAFGSAAAFTALFASGPVGQFAGGVLALATMLPILFLNQKVEAEKQLKEFQDIMVKLSAELDKVAEKRQETVEALAQSNLEINDNVIAAVAATERELAEIDKQFSDRIKKMQDALDELNETIPSENRFTALTTPFGAEKTNRAQVFDAAFNVLPVDQQKQVSQALQDLFKEHLEVINRINAEQLENEKTFAKALADNFEDYQKRLSDASNAHLDRLEEIQESVDKANKDHADRAIEITKNFNEELRSIQKDADDFADAYLLRWTEIQNEFAAAELARKEDFRQANVDLDLQDKQFNDQARFREKQYNEQFAKDQADLKREFADRIKDMRDKHAAGMDDLSIQIRQYHEDFELKARHRAEQFAESMDDIVRTHDRALSDIDDREEEAVRKANQRIRDSQEELDRSSVIPEGLQGFIGTAASNLALQRARIAQQRLDEVKREEKENIDALQTELSERRDLLAEDLQLRQAALNADDRRAKERDALGLKQFEENIANRRAASIESEISRIEEEQKLREDDLNFRREQFLAAQEFEAGQHNESLGARRRRLEENNNEEARLNQLRLDDAVADLNAEDIAFAASLEERRGANEANRVEQNRLNDLKLTERQAALDDELADENEKYGEQLTAIEATYAAQNKAAQDSYDERARALNKALNDPLVGEVARYRTAQNAIKQDVIDSVGDAETEGTIIWAREQERLQIEENIKTDNERWQVARLNRENDLIATRRDLEEKRIIVLKANQKTNDELDEQTNDRILKLAEQEAAWLRANGVTPEAAYAQVKNNMKRIEELMAAARGTPGDAIGLSAETAQQIQALETFAGLNEQQREQLIGRIPQSFGVTRANLVSRIGESASLAPELMRQASALGFGIAPSPDLGTYTPSPAASASAGLPGFPSQGVISLGPTGVGVEGPGPGIIAVNPLGQARSSVTSSFHDPDRPYHEGVDLDVSGSGESPSEALQPLFAPESGTLESAGYNGTFGLQAVIRGVSGMTHLLGHLGSVVVKIGSQVSGGQEIGTVGDRGSSGPSRGIQWVDASGAVHIILPGDYPQPFQDSDGSHLHWGVKNSRGRWINPMTILGSAQFGGAIPQTGLYQLHAGEFVMTNDHVERIINALNGQGRGISIENANFGDSFTDFKQFIDAYNFMAASELA